MSGTNKYLIKNISVSIFSKKSLKKLISSKINISHDLIKNITILKKSIDARNKRNIKYNYTCIIETTQKLKIKNDILIYKPPQPYIKEKNLISDKHPFIIGEGPAGLFAAIGLVEKGYEPYIFEKGKPITQREKDVEKFWQYSVLDENSNVQFGEGGAGTFSDGKLTARNQDYYTNKVFDYLIKFGADKNIKYSALPHLGTDKTRKIVENIRNYLISKNTKFFWNSSLNDIVIEKNLIKKIKINNDFYSPEILILATGNSAREIFKVLYKKEILISTKSFAVGFRIEHPQDFINQAIYGKNHKFLENASYRLTAKVENRGVYSFCMCPGGYVVASASEKNMQVTNGMSFSSRDNYLANSAIVVAISENDFGSNSLDGMKFQILLETKAFKKNFPYFSPFQTAKNFLENKKQKKIFETSYLPGTYLANFNEIFPANLSIPMKKALMIFDKKIKGFIKYGNILGVETRTSSPIRILRNPETFRSLTIKNLFPIGEGSGYAGGIISSAADGYKLSQTFFNK